jgi:mono/diheme cytochrome c family protein
MKGFRLCCHGAAMICGIAALSLAAGSASADPAANAAVGKLVYQRYCLSCHGERGDGRGEAADYMTVKPRDFRQGVYKWRSTASDSLPLDSDIERTLQNGLHGTYMPSYKWIDDRSRRDVIAYIKTFSVRFESEKPQDPIAIPPDPGYNDVSAARGASVYEKYQCFKCHGTEGRGDGRSARDLKDDWGNPSIPYDLTTGHVRSGDSSEDIYRVFMTGLSGSPMPAYADSLSSADAWDLVHYIQSLSAGYRKNFGPKSAGTP